MKPEDIKTALLDALDYWKPVHKKKFVVEIIEVVDNPEIAKDKTPTGKFGKKWEVTGVDFTNGLIKLKALLNNKPTEQSTAVWTPKFAQIESIKLLKTVDLGEKQ